MNTRFLIIITIIAISIIPFSLLYIPAYLKCQSLEGDLLGFDTCVLGEDKWMTCYDFDPVENVCVIDGMKIKDSEK